MQAIQEITFPWKGLIGLIIAPCRWQKYLSYVSCIGMYFILLTYKYNVQLSPHIDPIFAMYVYT